MTQICSFLYFLCRKICVNKSSPLPYSGSCGQGYARNPGQSMQILDGPITKFMCVQAKIYKANETIKRWSSDHSALLMTVARTKAHNM